MVWIKLLVPSTQLDILNFKEAEVPRPTLTRKNSLKKLFAGSSVLERLHVDDSMSCYGNTWRVLFDS